MNRTLRTAKLVALLVASMTALAGCGGTSDVNGEWAFTVSLEPDEAALPDDEITLDMNLMQAGDGSLRGNGSAEYGENSYEVEVREGQVSEDGQGLYLRLVGQDGRDHLDVKLYDDSEDEGVSGTAEGVVYFAPAEDPYGVGLAQAASFVGEEG